MSVMLSTLPNGLRVVTHEMPHLETASLGVWVGIGARSEAPAQHGISHLLEHMAFKGTARRSARDIVEEIESVGGDLNAATSIETTAYYARVFSRLTSRWRWTSSADILRDPKFDAAELAREQDVVLQEIAAAEDSPDDVVYDVAQEIAFPRASCWTINPREPGKVCARSRPIDLTDYMRTHYHAGSMILAAAGAVDHEKLVASLLKPHSAIWKRRPDRDTRRRLATLAGSATSRASSNSRTSWFLIPGPSYRDDAMYTAHSSSQACLAAGCHRACSRRHARRAVSATQSTHTAGACPIRGCSAYMPPPGSEQMVELAQVILAAT